MYQCLWRWPDQWYINTCNAQNTSLQVLSVNCSSTLTSGFDLWFSCILPGIPILTLRTYKIIVNKIISCFGSAAFVCLFKLLSNHVAAYTVHDVSADGPLLARYDVETYIIWEHRGSGHLSKGSILQIYLSSQECYNLSLWRYTEREEGGEMM